MNKNTDTHMDWECRREAVVWDGETPIAPNFYPLATEFRKWMLRKGRLWYFSSEDRIEPNSYTNPYTYDGSNLSMALTQIINETSAFTKSDEKMDSTEAEIKRLRLYSENVLYTARLLEALIKQLLYCTSFQERDYNRAALGFLLSKDCRPCRSAKRECHTVSLLGSLAHKYQLCFPHECLSDMVRIVNRRRNLQAAHSATSEFTIRGVAASREQADRDLIGIGNEFIHILQHIGEIEDKMLGELQAGIASVGKRTDPVVRLIVKRATS